MCATIKARQVRQSFDSPLRFIIIVRGTIVPGPRRSLVGSTGCIPAILAIGNTRVTMVPAILVVPATGVMSHVVVHSALVIPATLVIS